MDETVGNEGEPDPYTHKEVIVYTVGVCYLSVCVRTEVDAVRMTRLVNSTHPTGLSHGWEIARERFADGQANPSPCNTSPGRRHVLFIC